MCWSHCNGNGDVYSARTRFNPAAILSCFDERSWFPATVAHMAHLGKDSYSHIHFDDGQARTISVREAARLQSFPDGFVLRGSMNPAFKQIGNAVPPLVAYAIAREIRSMIGCRRLPDNGILEEIASGMATLLKGRLSASP